MKTCLAALLRIAIDTLARHGFERFRTARLANRRASTKRGHQNTESAAQAGLDTSRKGETNETVALEVQPRMLQTERGSTPRPS